MTGGGLHCLTWLVVGVHRALIVEADGHGASNVFAKHDDGGFGAGAGRIGVRIVGVGQFAVLMLRQSSGTLLLGRSPCCLDGDKLRPRGNLAVDMRGHLGLIAGSVKALVSPHVRKQAGIETAAAGATRCRKRTSPVASQSSTHGLVSYNQRKSDDRLSSTRQWCALRSAALIAH